MCGTPEHSKVSEDNDDNGNVALIEKQLSKMKQTQKCFSVLLELAANNDLIGFKQAVEEDGSAIDEISFWYGRQNGSKKMGLEQRTPLMVAALFGSIDVLSYILSAYATCGIDVNLKCGSDRCSALHCAAAGGSSFAIEAVKLLLQSAADVNCFNAYGKRPADVIVVSPKLSNAKVILNDMLKAEYHSRAGALTKVLSRVSDYGNSDLSGGGSNGLGSLPHLSSLEAQSPKVLMSSPKIPEASRNCADGIEKKEYPVDPSLPDIKNGMYSTDEFRMYSFKVRPCSRAYSHDWTECPFVHPGENARRRDPRKYHYTSVPCPEFRKGTCRRGDLCEFAHGVFECWLHPAQYRTRLCKDETNCTRRVCFFAHKPEELRPLSVFTGSAVPSPRAPSSLDMNSTMSPLTLGSPSSVFMMSSLSPSNPPQGALSTPPMSPSSSSANTLAHSSFGGAWPQPNVPTLHLPGGSLQVGLQTSRLRASLSARDVALEELTRDSDCEGQLINDFSSLPGPGNTLFRSGKYKSHGGSSVAPINLEDLFASEMMSPRAPGLEPSVFSQLSSQIQSHKAAQAQPQMQTPISNQISQIHQMQQGAIGAQGSGHLHSSVQPSHCMSSLGQMSSLGLDLERQNSNGSALSPALMAAMKSRSASFGQRDIRCYSSRDLGANVSLPSLADWGSPTGKANWGVQKGELNKFRKSASFGVRTSDEPDLSWVQTSAKVKPVDAVEGCTVGFSLEALRKRQSENINNAVLGAWAEQQMHLDQQMVA